VSPASLLAGRYELGERLGTGGMSTVLGAFDRRLERAVAVKLLAEHLADDPQFISRFRREALAAGRLVHPNIVQVFDFGLDEPSGRHYIVMELIRGHSGAEILRDRGALGVQETLAIVGQACRGLAYAHRHGVVHRDVKPGNLLRGEDAIVKLADFGIAKALSDESSITQVGSVVGTAAYLAPEQAAGEVVGPAADQYALGVVTYQFLSGRLPYEAQSLPELAFKQQRESPVPLDGLVDEVSPQLAAAVDRALALDPRERFADADALRDALMDGARGIGPTAMTTRALEASTEATSVVAPRRPRAPRAGPTPAPAPPSAPAQRRAVARERPRRGRARRIFLTLVAILFLAAGGGAAVILTSTSQDAVNLREVVYEDVDRAVQAIKGLIEENTQ